MIFNAFGYQFFFGYRGSGKNRSHEISNELCFHTLVIANTRSISSIFRSVDAMGAVILKNEAETLIGKNKDNDLLELCLEGYKAGSSIPLTSDYGKNKNREVILFDVYSPKSFASDKNIYGAFGSRTIRYILEKTLKKQGKVDLDKNYGKKIRDDAYLLRLQDGCKLSELVRNTTIDDLLDGYDLDLVSRDREIFYLLLFMTRQYGSGEEYDDLVSFIEDYLQQQKEESIEDPVAIVLRAVKYNYDDRKKCNEKLKDEDKIWININDIKDTIIFDDPEAWKMVKKGDYEDREIIRSNPTVKFYTSKKIGSILDKNGFSKKRRNKGRYQRLISGKKLEIKAKTLNIDFTDIDYDIPQKEIRIKSPNDNERCKDAIDKWVADVLPKTDDECDADILSDDENNFEV